MRRAISGERGRGFRERAFTLVEVLAVIAIISILVGLLFVALGRGRAAAVNTRIRSEISALERALEAFKNTFGDYPPSRMRLPERGAGWNTSDPVVVRTKAVLRSFWPEFDFRADRDFDGDGAITSRAVDLYSDTCMVFFLGGRTEWKDANGNGVVDIEDRVQLLGFSKNPADPFEATSRNRVGPFFEFDQSRLMPAFEPDGRPTFWFFGYRDPLDGTSMPYIYVSASGQGYSPSDLMVAGMTSPYLHEAGDPWNPKSFQIISAGFDRQFGPGGRWSAEKGDSLLVGPRSVERDNLTNIHSGPLATN